MEEQEPAVMCIKIADRIHNLQAINAHPNPEKRVAVMAEIAEIIISICNYIIKTKKISNYKE